MGKLQIEKLAKTYGDKVILQDISFQIHNGEFVSILGPSGCGKSTLFRLIGGMDMPNHGEISLDGRSIIGKRGMISYTPQSPSLFPWRTILKNVLLGAEIAGVQAEQQAVNMLKRAGLAGYERAYPHELSGGMRQRVAFVRSLLCPQPIICLDEPFSALDEFTRLDMQKWLLSIWQDDRRSILFVTHHIDEAIFLSDRVIVLSEKPTTVQREFIIPFERPRQESILLSEEFLGWKRAIYQALGGSSIEQYH